MTSVMKIRTTKTTPTIRRPAYSLGPMGPAPLPPPPTEDVSKIAGWKIGASLELLSLIQSKMLTARAPTWMSWIRSVPIRSPARNWKVIWPVGLREPMSAPSYAPSPTRSMTGSSGEAATRRYGSGCPSWASPLRMLPMIWIELVVSAGSSETTAIVVVVPRSITFTRMGVRATPTARTASRAVETKKRRPLTRSPNSRFATSQEFARYPPSLDGVALTRWPPYPTRRAGPRWSGPAPTAACPRSLACPGRCRPGGRRAR